jgi:hypothetical protein
MSKRDLTAITLFKGPEAPQNRKGNNDPAKVRNRYAFRLDRDVTHTSHRLFRGIC